MNLYLSARSQPGRAELVDHLTGRVITREPCPEGATRFGAAVDTIVARVQPHLGPFHVTGFYQWRVEVADEPAQ